MTVKNLTLFLLILTIASFASETIPYKILKEKVYPYKASYDIEVPLVKGKLPNKQQIKDISIEVQAQSNKKPTFVLIYLPGMEVGAGAYATAHHDPDLSVDVIELTLIEYPKYLKLLPKKKQREYLKLAKEWGYDVK